MASGKKGLTSSKVNGIQDARNGSALNASGMGDFIASLTSLADGTRLRLLRQVENQELSVADLCTIVQCPQSTVSRHLKQLIDQGWTKSRRKGTTNLYRMAKQDLDEAATALWRVTAERMSCWPTVKQDDLRLEKLLNQRAHDAEAFFAGTAAQWDQLRESLYGELPFVEAMLPLVDRSRKLVDLGCGTGLTLARLAPWIDELVGVDQSSEMLKAARRRLQGKKNVKVMSGKLQQLSLEDGMFDAALMMLVLTYLPEPVVALKEAARILKPGGRIMILDLMHHEDEHFQDRMEHLWPGFEEGQLADMLGAAGFTPIHFLAVERKAGTNAEEAGGGMLFLSVAERQ